MVRASSRPGTDVSNRGIGVLVATSLSQLIWLYTVAH